MKDNKNIIFEQFVKDIKKKFFLAGSVWITLVIFALILFTVDIRLSIVVGILGVVLGYINITERMKYKSAFQNVTDMAQFYKEVDECSDQVNGIVPIIILNNYVVSAYGNLQIYSIQSIQKVELGIVKEGIKPSEHIFITLLNEEKRRLLYMVLVNRGIPEEFHTVYEKLRERINH